MFNFFFFFFTHLKRISAPLDNTKTNTCTHRHIWSSLNSRTHTPTKTGWRSYPDLLDGVNLDPASRLLVVVGVGPEYPVDDLPDGGMPPLERVWVHGCCVVMARIDSGSMPVAVPTPRYIVDVHVTSSAAPPPRSLAHLFIYILFCCWFRIR